jgi:RNA polymerase sigma factor (sigma-70 family)
VDVTLDDVGEPEQPPSAKPAVRAATLDLDARDAQQATLALLVTQMALGNETALAELYDMTAARVHGLAVRICGTAQLAEEVTADTFYQAWTESARYDLTRGRVLTWLLVIARSRALDALRARDKAVLHEDPATLVDETLQPRARGVEELLELAQESTALKGLLVNLSPVQRQMIALAFYQGMSHGEIAAHSGLPLGTVKAHVRRALGVLRGALGAP